MMHQIVDLIEVPIHHRMGAAGQNKCEAGGWAYGWVASLLFCGGWVELGLKDWF